MKSRVTIAASAGFITNWPPPIGTSSRLGLNISPIPHDPDSEAFAKASTAELNPVKLESTLAFMLESRWPFRPTALAMSSATLDADYAQCWAGVGPRP